MYLQSTEEFGFNPPEDCDRHGLVLDAEGDKGGYPLVPLTGLSDAGACVTNSCGSRTVCYVYEFFLAFR